LLRSCPFERFNALDPKRLDDRLHAGTLDECECEREC
jgi:hypothetical protein